MSKTDPARLGAPDDVALSVRDYRTGTTTAVRSLFFLYGSYSDSGATFRTSGPTPAAVRWRAFSSVGGLAQFSALMIGVVTFTGELPNVVYFDPSPETRDIYNPILQS
jgi:hypothetical protein